MAKEIKVKCDHCGKDISYDTKYRININIAKQASAKNLAISVMPFCTTPYGPSENYEIDLCDKCYRILNTKLTAELKQGEE